MQINKKMNDSSQAQHKDLNHPQLEGEDDPDYETVVAEQYGMNENAAVAAQPGALAGPIDHIARNAYISSKYRQMNGIRSQLNQDLMNTRLQNSQHRAQFHEEQKRLKSKQWLNKWDEFRVVKSQYVDRVLKILKDRRRVINLVALIKLSQNMRGIINNYELIKAFNMRKFSEIMIAIKLYVHFQRRFKGRYGEEFEHRQRNIIRTKLTFCTAAMTDQQEGQAKELLLNVLRTSKEKRAIENKMERFYHRVRFLQCSFKEMYTRSAIKSHQGLLRMLQEMMVLKQFYISQPPKNKIAARIGARLQDCFDNEITPEIRPKKNVDADDADDQQPKPRTIQELEEQIKLYDEIQAQKFKLKAMDNIQNQHRLFVDFLDKVREDDAM